MGTSPVIPVRHSVMAEALRSYGRVKNSNLSNALLGLDKLKKDVNKIVNSKDFQSILKSVDQINQVAHINIATITKSPFIKDLQHNIELLDKNKERILSAFTTTISPLIENNHKIEQKMQFIENNKSIYNSNNNQLENKEFINFDYQLTIIQKENNNLKTKIEFLEEENKKLLLENNRFIESRSIGGKNSYQNYKPLKNKVEELYKLELGNKKYSSANQLSKVIARIILNKYSDLLDNFQPYQNFLREGEDWQKPTFYGWCNKNFKKFNNL